MHGDIAFIDIVRMHIINTLMKRYFLVRWITISWLVNKKGLFLKVSFLLSISSKDSEIYTNLPNL